MAPGVTPGGHPWKRYESPTKRIRRDPTSPRRRAHHHRPVAMSTPISVRRGSSAHDNFTIVPNALIRDRRLSAPARMLAIWLLSHRADFRFGTPEMATAMNVGRDRTRASLAELQDAGYLQRHSVRQNGRLAAIEYVIHDEPQVNASDGLPGPEKQAPENPSPYKKSTKYVEDQRPEDQRDSPSPAGDGVPSPADPPPTSAQSRRANEVALSADFEGTFWPHYPRKVGKIAARNAYLRARRNGATAEDLTAGARSFAVVCKDREARFIPHPSTWLNAGRWQDEPDKPSAPVDGGPRPYRDADHYEQPPQRRNPEGYVPEDEAHRRMEEWRRRMQETKVPPAGGGSAVQ